MRKQQTSRDADSNSLEERSMKESTTAFDDTHSEMSDSSRDTLQKVQELLEGKKPVRSEWEGVYYSSEKRDWVWAFEYEGTRRRGHVPTELEAARMVNRMCREKGINMWNAHVTHNLQYVYQMVRSLDAF